MLGKELRLAKSLERTESCILKIFYTLKGEIKHIFSDDLEFIAACLTYIIAHVVDYLFTVPAITDTVFEDGNPIIQEYISHFGIENGLLVYKLLICGSVILGMKSVDFVYKNKETKFRVKYILYGGAILTAFGGSLWLY